MSDDIISVTGIIEKNYKSGVSEKTGKNWSIHKYQASTGVEFTSFDDLEIGDVITLTKNDYGWQGQKPRKADTQHEEIMKALKATYAKLLEIEKKL